VSLLSINLVEPPCDVSINRDWFILVKDKCDWIMPLELTVG